MLLEIAHLNVRYEKAVLINDLSMGVDTGELVSLVGPNGAGKSTTLRAITGLVAWEREIKRRSTAGDIHWKERSPSMASGSITSGPRNRSRGLSFVRNDEDRSGK